MMKYVIKLVLIQEGGILSRPRKADQESSRLMPAYPVS